MSTDTSQSACFGYINTTFRKLSVRLSSKENVDRIKYMELFHLRTEVEPVIETSSFKH
jgi:hypothetical protein